MHKRFSDRLEALEKARGIEHYVILYGDDCDRFDLAMTNGDHDAAFDILMTTNPYVDAEALRQVVRESAPYRSLDRTPGVVNSTFIRVQYGDLT